jgi:hypothetical protein
LPFLVCGRRERQLSAIGVGAGFQANPISRLQRKSEKSAVLSFDGQVKFASSSLATSPKG